MQDAEIRLLGRPEIRRGGTAVAPPRGRKAWAVLAFILLSEQPVSRERLASLLFAEARDPLGALRWTLAELRRALGVPEALRGNPLSPAALRDRVSVDVMAVCADLPDPALIRGELLEGIDPGGDGVFASWLTVERRRWSGICEGVLHAATLVKLAGDHPRDAAALASRALELNPFDETLHELLVRCLVRSGDVGAARHQATRCEVLFERELGRQPDARIRRAAEEGVPGAGAIGDPAAAWAQLRAGNAALEAGAVEPGIACLRSACAEARAAGDSGLLSHALVTLGSALVHAVRGRDEEAAALLHEGLAVATPSRERAMIVVAARELGYVDVQAGRPVAASRWLHRATELAATDEERAAVLGVRGMALSDRAHYAPAIRLFSQSVAAAERAVAGHQAAWSLALLGRTLLLRNELEAAAEALDRSLELIAVHALIALQPLPEALRGEVALRQGDIDRATKLVDHAFSLGCHIADPCWEAFAARACGLLHAQAGQHGTAVTWLRDAALRATRVADGYVWAHAHCLDALAGALIDEGAADALSVVETLEGIAAHGDMRELVVRAAMHRARLGDRSAGETARLLAESIENPGLEAELAAV